jgi:hypothetical protein
MRSGEQSTPNQQCRVFCFRKSFSTSSSHFNLEFLNFSTSWFSLTAEYPDSSALKSDTQLHCLLPTALQVVVPFGVALPLVKKESRDGRSGRPVHQTAEHAHATYGTRLARLDYYFSQLEVRCNVAHREVEYVCLLISFICSG